MKKIFNFIKTIVSDFQGIFMLKDTKMLEKVEDKIILSADEEPTERMPFSLEPVKEFLEDFIGLAITDFKTYNDQVSDLSTKVYGKIISEVILLNNRVWIKLSKFNGSPGGYLRIEPSIVGEFTAMDSEDEIVEQTLYRIIFFGGSCLEYLDHKSRDSIQYHDTIKE